MSENKKYTKLQKFAMLGRFIEVCECDDMTPPVRKFLSEFVAHEVALLAKKSKGTKKETQAQIDGAKIRTIITECATVNVPFTITEMLEMVLPEVPTASVQKVTAQTTRLVNEGILVRHHAKSGVNFTLAE